jgi:proton-dependent oligopeptide transporter, POT family
MKSFVMALYMLTTAVAAALGLALSEVSKNPHLVWFYASISITAVVGGTIFWLLFNKYNGREDEMDTLDAKDPQRAVPIAELSSHRRDVNPGEEEVGPLGEKAA